MKHMVRMIAPDTPGRFDAIYECVDCLETFRGVWPADNLPESECAGEPTPVARAVRDATTGLPDSVMERLAAAIFGEEEE